MSDAAVVVGVSRYDQSSDWNLPGPCTNACAIAASLLTFQPRPEIFLFVDPPPAPFGQASPFDAPLRGLADAGVRVTQSAAWTTIDTFCFDTLRQNRPPQSRLLVFWSGHGFTDTDGSRVLICRDYTADALTNRVLNATNFLRHLRSPLFRSFSDQLFVADVCGIYSGLTFNSTRNAPASVEPRTQLCLFATPEGEYAEDDQGHGVFTRIVLDVLARRPSWPAQADFNQAVTDALAVAGRKPFRISSVDDGQEAPDRLVGSITGQAGSVLFKSIAAVLGAVDMPDTMFRPHYLRVVSDLGEPKLSDAQGLTGMLRELASMQDGTRSGGVPYGLLEFLMRLQREPSLSAAISDWLQAHAAGQNQVLATIRQKLDDENRTKILVVDIETDEAGSISAFQPFVRLHDFLPAPVDPRPRQEVTDWDDFTASLLKVIADLRRDSATRDFDIHFLADPPLFDRAFHLIEMPSGDRLGEEFVVVLRHRQRVLGAPALVRDAWRQYAAALRTMKPSAVNLVRIELTSSAKDLQDAARGLWCMGFVVRRTAAGTSADASEKRLLLKLLRLGVPYLYWLHDGPIDDATWTDIEATMRGWLGGVQSLDRFPVALTQGRIAGDRLAADATLLWDDPEFVPFLTTPGVKRQ